MGSKKKQTHKSRLYILPNDGGIIAGQENTLKSGITIWIRNPAFVSNREDGVGYIFSPLRYVTGEMELFPNSLLGAIEMPEDMVPWYRAYLLHRETQLEAAPE